ncbi:hypothetical protein [Haladaptatus halobius]|uniref:hypothetical protein n=1 Tax=Haladaptatus halobius TaxID=2884875 RepID=UPI001D0A10F4|nr:hypothetical protein [Haladaptatus halobius]
MAGVRETLAAVLGIGIGILLVAYPEVFIRIQTVGRLPYDRGGEYGTTASLPTRWRRLVQLVGIGCLLFGVYLAVTAIR